MEVEGGDQRHGEERGCEDSERHCIVLPPASYRLAFRRLTISPSLSLSLHFTHHIVVCIHVQINLSQE